VVQPIQIKPLEPAEIFLIGFGALSVNQLSHLKDVARFPGAMSAVDIGEIKLLAKLQCMFYSQGTGLFGLAKGLVLLSFFLSKQERTEG
jgi:hypothetical protein